MTKLLLLSRGYFTLVDDEDFEWASKVKWSAMVTGSRVSARRMVCRDGRRVPVHLSREILGAAAGEVVDHINGDSLDNRRANLRPASVAQNAQNRRSADPRSKTGVRGVIWEPRRQRYRAIAKVQGKQFYFGDFPTIEQAERAAIAGRQRIMTHAG
jgi:hypothetical protein